MGKVLYFMHVPWSWIKQRPQFLAEQLAKSSNVTVIAPDDDQIKKTTVLVKDRLIIKRLITLTKSTSGFAYLLQIYLRRLQIGSSLLKNKVVWLSFPNQYNLVKLFLRKRHYVIYDCMDDAVEFYEDLETRELFIALENEIVKRANLIICSSEHLKRVLIERHRIRKNIFVINNALHIDTIPCAASSAIDLSDNIKSLFSDKQYKYLVYIGTISSWFDFRLTEDSLRGTNVKIVIFGPKEVEVPLSCYIVYGGILPHNQVRSAMMIADALVMPFKLSKLVLSVNPVKAYEYISSGKPTIMVDYPETDKFREFAYLYSSPEEFLELVHLVDSGQLKAKKDREACITFARQNTWESRAGEIEAVFNKTFIED